MARIIAICGKICAGKSYYAHEITEKENAVILSCDEVTKALFDNDLGEKHDEMAHRIWEYLQTKSVELVRCGCTVILDWGFWRSADRKRIMDFYRAQGIACEWHYIDVDDATWRKNIEERNARVARGEGGCDYYLDEGLLAKCLSRWEMPTRDEIDVWHTYRRED